MFKSQSSSLEFDEFTDPKSLHNQMLNNYYSAMASYDQEDYSMYQINDKELLSFENPNYLGGLKRIEDHLNCNTFLEETSLYEELKSAQKTFGKMDETHSGPFTELDNKCFSKDSNRETIESNKLEERETEKNEEFKRRQNLPSGWEKHEDENGPYFWHIKSGTIQRNSPKFKEEKVSEVIRNARSSKIFDDDFVESLYYSGKISKSCTVSSIADLSKNSSFKREIEDKSVKRRSYPISQEFNKIMEIRVKFLGQLELLEEELTPDNSSKAVNRCIVQLSESYEKMDSSSSSPEICLILDESSLRVVNEFDEDSKSQAIHTIRVWGVGRDNPHDFAYVARDKQSRRHYCHVFRCEVPARSIANALRDICKKILIERSLAQSSSKFNTTTSTHTLSEPFKRIERLRPVNLGAKLQSKTLPAPEFFPTPLQEPHTSMKASYLGSTFVDKPTGIDVIKNGIEEIQSQFCREEWKRAKVYVAPSTISISFKGVTERIECRVRFLSFLGIGNNARNCGFIVHTAEDTFQLHAFSVEPTAGPLCKIIEGACKLRYQKCLDARSEPSTHKSKAFSNKSLGTTLKKFLGSFKAKGIDSSHELT